jgi:tRNA-splicing ligase RtcB
MCAVRTSLSASQLPESLRQLRNQIERDVPVGFNMHNNRNVRFKAASTVEPGLKEILDRHPGITSKSPRKDSWARQIGTLGGGNHFIEICLDEEDRVWIMLHSGSRGIGNKIGQYFIEKAKEVIAQADVHLPDRDLAYLTEGSGLFADYWQALTWAQEYAARNRQEMLDIVIEALGRTLPPFDTRQRKRTTVPRSTSPVREQFVPAPASSELFRGQWVLVPTSFAARAMRSHFAPARMVRVGVCRVVPHGVNSAGKTWSSRPRVSNAVRIRVLSTKSRVPTRTSIR